MLTDRIIGRVGAEVLSRRLVDARQGDGAQFETASLFRLDKLSSGQIASIVREILANPEMLAKIDLQIPASLIIDQDLPESVLTSLNAGAVRNAGTDKEALLTANGNEHNLADTLGHVTALGAKEFRSHPDAWVEATCHVAEIAPVPDDRAIFKAALTGLIDASDLSLVQLGDYCSRISEAICSRGYAIREAIGWALPLIGLPRDTSFFSNTRSYGVSLGPWRKAFEKLFSTRAPLLSKIKSNGQPLDIDEMRQRLQENREEINDSVIESLEAFINAPSGDEFTSNEIAQFEWEKDGIHLIFDKPRERQLGLAEATLHFFDHECNDSDVLVDQWRKYLEDLKARQRRSDWSDEEDESFFELHRRYLQEDLKLHSRWEKVIFGKPIECFDFLEGFTSVAYSLLAKNADISGNRFLRFTVSKGRKDWRERFNFDVGAYFSAMYRGLPELLGSLVEWRVLGTNTANLPDPLFQYPSFFNREKELQKRDIKPVSSLARTAVQIKFEVSLCTKSSGVEKIIDKTQLIWSYRPESIGLSLVEDMKRLQEKGGVSYTEVSRKLVSKKGGVQSVSLSDTGTLEASYSRDAGSLVPPANRLGSLRAEIKRCIEDLASEGRLTKEQRNEIRNAWDKFEFDYIDALNDFINIGLHGESVLRQADSFSNLLRTLSLHARGDVCRGKLISLVLTIGTVRIVGDQAALIIPPWHPERMKALAVKSRRVAGLVSHLLTNENVLFGDRGIFFREFSEELAHAFYPEIAVVHRAGVPTLVSESSSLNGYSLLESPVRVEIDDLTDVDPSVAAKQVHELLERYVGLQPHEASNLGVLLYNSDAAELPLAVVRELEGLQTDSNFKCSVSVRHRDASKLRRVYAELVTKSGNDPDLPVVSESSDNFISKLRIAVSTAKSTAVTKLEGFRPFDIAFLHDVISGTATVEWIAVDWSNDRPSLEHAPSRWSYRCVSGENELKSTTFLTCPRQTSSGWSYVNAIYSVVRQTDISGDITYLPARQISLQNQTLKDTLDDAHGLAEWVATFDELLDKRQLQANGITVVRYRRASTNGRNMIVSSTSELRLLSVLARRRLSELALPFNSDELESITNRIKSDALSISGDIILRAAKRGVSTGEMLGLVLSRYLIDSEFRSLSETRSRQCFSVFFLLDDYADWLAQKENRIADILGLFVEEREDGPHLHIAVVESKYVSSTGSAEAKRASKAQLLATLSTFRDAIFGEPGRLDRDVWLSRLADMLLDAEVPPGCTDLLERTRSKLREGRVGISLRGYSHIFIHSPDSNISSEQSLVDLTDGIQAWQEVFDRPELRNLVEIYSRKGDPQSVRRKLGAETPWLSCSTRLPAQRITWSPIKEILPSEVELISEVSGSGTSNLNSDPVKTSITEGHAEVDNSPIIKEVPVVSEDLRSSIAKVIEEKSKDLTRNVDERQAWSEEVTRKLRVALNGYGLQAAVIGTRLTPNGCLIRLAGSDKLRVEDIESKRMQLLTTHAINLVTVQPKPGEIVITVASEKRQPVSLWGLWAQRKININAAGINTSFVLGLQEINGEPLYLNLGSEFGGLASHDPHSLVAGTTGSGKSVLIQALLLDIAATNSKELAQIVLIDPKMGVDYSSLEDLPHFREKIVTTKERATEVLSEVVDEMESRYQLFAAARTRDLTIFNSKADVQDRLPMLFVVHDEFADWMLDADYKDSVSAAVQRLGVKARAAGIHLIFAAQRPDKDVMPMQLRENLGSRLILKVASEATSKIALDRSGAELLLGKGHLAAKLNGEQGLIFAQVPFLSDTDIALAVDAIRSDNL